MLWTARYLGFALSKRERYNVREKEENVATRKESRWKSWRPTKGRGTVSSQKWDGAGKMRGITLVAA